MQQSDSSLYIQVVRITHVYLGPAADRFINRQIQSHLHKDPDELSRQDLSSLIDWIKISISLITDDEVIIGEYVDRLQKLTIAHESPKEPHHAS